MSEEKINLISVKLYTEYYKNNIKDRYIRNYSDNTVIDNDVLKADYGEYVYITTLDKHNKLQQENQKYKEVIDKLKKVIDECWYMDNENIGMQVFSKKCELKDILKEGGINEC